MLIERRETINVKRVHFSFSYAGTTAKVDASCLGMAGGRMYIEH
ncbi:MAG: hypothetical protein QM668_21900 [Agriterribacter sp.]